MATEVRWRRGTTAENDNFTGAEGEITVNTDDYSLHIHDGVTSGGMKSLTEGIIGSEAEHESPEGVEKLPRLDRLYTAGHLTEIGSEAEHESPEGVEKLARLDRLYTSHLAKVEAVKLVPVRQTVLTGPVDGDGRADFLSAGTDLEVVTDDLTSTTLRATFGDGFDTDGEANFVASIDSNLSWEELTDDDVNYLYLDLDPSTGVVTTGHTTLPPEYSYTKPETPDSGQYWYPVDHRSRGEYYDGSAWQPVLRLFVGQAETDSGAVVETRSYAYQGRNVSNLIATTGSSPAVFVHDLGVGSMYNYTAECTPKTGTTLGGWSHGEFIMLFSNQGPTDTRRLTIGRSVEDIRMAPRQSEFFVIGDKEGGSGTGVDTDEVDFRFIVWRAF